MAYQDFNIKKNAKFLLILLFMIGLILRTMFVHLLRLDWDEGLYLFIGYLHSKTGLVNGIMNNFPRPNGTPYNQPPLIPLLYSLLYSVFPLDYGIGRFLNVLLSSFCVPLIYMTVKEIWDQKTGLVAAVLVTMDPTLVTGILMGNDGLTNLLFCVTCYTIVKAVKEDTMTWHLITGICFGLCMLTKWTLTIVPITYVVYYAHYSLWRNKKNQDKRIKHVIASASVAFALFLPWFIWMGINGNYSILFGYHVDRLLRITNPLYNIALTCIRSPLLFLLAIFSFRYYFVNQKEMRFFLLYGLFVILPFFLILPTYDDYSSILYLFAILGAKLSTYLFEQSFLFFSNLRRHFSGLNRINVDYNLLFSATTVLLLFGTNGGSIAYEAIFERDQTVQQVVEYVKSSTSEDAVVICQPQYGALVTPRHWISSLEWEIGNNYYLIYTPIHFFAPIYVEGVKNGFVIKNDTIFRFNIIETINDVQIYLISAELS